MNRKLLYLLLLFFSINSFSQICVKLSFNMSDFDFIQSDSCLYVETKLQNSRMSGELNSPKLPYFPYRIILPPNEEDSLIYSLDYSSKLIYPNVRLCSNHIPFANKATNVLKNSFSPATKSVSSPVRFKGIHNIDKIRFAFVEVTPFVYDHTSNQLNFVPEIVVTFNSSKLHNNTKKKDCDNTQISINDAYIRNRFINPDDYYNYYSMEQAQTQEINVEQVNANFLTGDIVTRHNYITDYLIITTESLKLGFRSLASWKNMKCLRTAVITMEDLASYYDTIVTPDIIRRYLNDIHLYSTGQQKKWLVLGGDVDHVPTMYFRERHPEWNQNDRYNNYLPSDYYYACPNLTKNDTVINDGITFDYFEPQLYVSRIPVSTAIEAHDYTVKLCSYESGNTDGSNLLLACHKFDNYIGDYSDAYLFTEKMYSDYIQNNWSGNVTKLYDTGSSVIINKHNLFNEIENEYGLILMNSHGTYKQWELGERNENHKHYMRDSAYVQTNYPGSVILTGACFTNAFDDIDGNCLSEAMIRNPNGGAVSYFGCSRTAYGGIAAINYSTIEYSDLFNARFLYHLYHSDIPYAPYSFGSLAAQAKKDLISSIDNESLHYLYYDFMHSINSIGDPEMQIYTDTPQTFLEDDLPYISYNTPYADYISFSANTDCILYLKGYGTTTNIAKVVPLQCYQSTTFYAPEGCYITVLKKNHIPLSYYVSTSMPEDEASSYVLREVQEDEIIRIRIENENSHHPIAINGGWTVCVTNALTGDVVASEEVKTLQSSFNTSAWPKGIYVIKAYINNRILTNKVSVR